MPRKDGYVFLGFWTQPEGKGEQWYTAQATAMKTFYKLEEMKLYAYFMDKKDVKWTGVYVNDMDVALRSGSGWGWNPNTCQLTFSNFNVDDPSHVISGTNTDDRVLVNVADSVALELKNLCITRTSKAAGADIFTIASGKTVSMTLSGKSRFENGSSGAALAVDGTLTLTNSSTVGEVLVCRGGGASPGIRTAGSFTIRSGRVFAYGGTSGVGVGGEASWSSSSSGTFRMTGGTLRAEGGASSAYDVGPYANDRGSVCMRLTGGSLFAARSKVRSDVKNSVNQPVNDAGQSLYCVRTAVPASTNDLDGVRIADIRLPGDYAYGTNGLYAIDGRVYLWLPNNTAPRFTVDGVPAWATINGANTDAYFAETGVRVSNVEVGLGIGDGWRWFPGTSNLWFTAADRTYNLTGSATNADVLPIVDCNLNLEFENLKLLGYGIQHGIFCVRPGANLAVKLIGTSRFHGIDSHYRGSAIALAEGASLTLSSTAATPGLLCVTGGHWGAGINVPPGATFTHASGQLIAAGGVEAAGVGGVSGEAAGTLTLTGGTRTLTSGLGAQDAGAGGWTSSAGSYDRPLNAADAGTDSSGSLVVTTLGDSGPGSLRAAMRYASQVGGTVTFAPDLTGEIRLASRIALNGAAAVTVDTLGAAIGLAPASVFTPSDGGGAILNAGTGSLTLRGLAFTGFTASCGGALRSQAALVCENCTFTGCSASTYGGAVYVAPSGSFQATNCRFSENAAAVSGGAVYARERLRFTRCSFTDNEARYAGAAAAMRAPGRTFTAEHVFCARNAAGERAGGLDVAAGALLAGACTLAENPGGGLYSEETLVTVSTLSTGNTTTIAVRPPDGDTRGSFHAYACTFAWAGPSFAEDSVRVRLGSTPALSFNGGWRTSDPVDGVTHVYRQLTHANKAHIQGCAVWTSLEGSTIGYSARVGATPTAFYGNAPLTQLADTDLLGVARDNSNLLVGAVTDAAEEESLVVTTRADTVDPEDHLTSLREAIHYTASVDLVRRASDGYSEISFASTLFTNVTGELTLSRTNAYPVTLGRRIAIDGRVPQGVVTFRGKAGLANIFTVDGVSRLEMKNCLFKPAANRSDALISSSGIFTGMNCLFDGEGQGTPALEALSGTESSLALEQCTLRNATIPDNGAFVTWNGAKGRLFNSTVDRNTGGANAAVVRAKAGQADIVNVTCTTNAVGTGGAAVFVENANLYALNAILVGNVAGGVLCDFAQNGSGGYNLYYTVYGFYPTGVSFGTRQSCVSSATAADTFYGDVRNDQVNGVQHDYRRVLNSTTSTGAYGKGCFAFHDSSWGALAYAKRKNGASKKSVHGSVNVATLRVGTDIMGREIAEGYVSPGSYATCKEMEYFEDGEIIVNTANDTTVSTASEWDGIVSLREAMEFADATPTFRTADGACNIRFADSIFDASGGATILWKSAQIETYRSFATGVLRVAPPTGKRLFFDGNGRQRLFFVGASNHVEFLSCTFTNTLANVFGSQIMMPSGGAIHNRGYLTASNCVFRDCWAGGDSLLSRTRPLFSEGFGGAVATGQGGHTLLRDCTFTGNRAIRGGALYTYPGGCATAVNCTFSQNRAVNSTVSVAAPAGGAVCAAGNDSRTLLVNCTLAGNASDHLAGGVCAEGGSAGPVLYMLGCVAVGNTAPVTADLHSAYGEARLGHTLYGARNTGGDAHWTDTAVTGDVTCEEVFGRATPVASSGTIGGVTHDWYPVRRLACTPVWARVAWEEVGAMYGETKADKLFCGTLRKVRTQGKDIKADQRGTALEQPICGAVALEPALTAVLRTTSSAEPTPEEAAAIRERFMTDFVSSFTARGVPAVCTPAAGLSLAQSVAACTEALRDRPWFTVRAVDGVVRMELNEAATPSLAAADEAEVDLTSDAAYVFVYPANVKPGLYYALGHSTTPVGPYLTTPEDWVRAEADGTLPCALTAPRLGSGGFYRVMVRGNLE